MQINRSRYQCVIAKIIMFVSKLFYKIVLNVSKEFLNKQKTKNYLLELEEILKKNVDFRLEIFIKMMLDVSKLRVGKSFKDFKV